MAQLTSIADVAGVIPNRARVILGIAGAPGSGKSTIAEALVHHLGAGAIVLPMDGFHLSQAELRRLGRRDRMGAPDTFDVDGFVATLTAIAEDTAPVHAPGFDRTIEEAVPDAITIAEASRIIVVEGNYLLLARDGWERVAPLIDVSIFVDLDDEVRHERLIDRHIRFGKSPEDATAWALGPDERNARTITASASNAEHRMRLAPGNATGRER